MCGQDIDTVLWADMTLTLSKGGGQKIKNDVEYLFILVLFKVATSCAEYTLFYLS